MGSLNLRSESSARERRHENPRATKSTKYRRAEVRESRSVHEDSARARRQIREASHSARSSRSDDEDRSSVGTESGSGGSHGARVVPALNRRIRRVIERGAGQSAGSRAAFVQKGRNRRRAQRWCCREVVLRCAWTTFPACGRPDRHRHGRSARSDRESTRSLPLGACRRSTSSDSRIKRAQSMDVLLDGTIAGYKPCSSPRSCANVPALTTAAGKVTQAHVVISASASRGSRHRHGAEVGCSRRGRCTPAVKEQV